MVWSLNFSSIGVLDFKKWKSILSTVELWNGGSSQIEEIFMISILRYFWKKVKGLFHLSFTDMEKLMENKP